MSWRVTWKENGVVHTTAPIREKLDAWKFQKKMEAWWPERVFQLVEDEAVPRARSVPKSRRSRRRLAVDSPFGE